MKDHRVINIADLSSGDVAFASTTTRMCSDHPGEEKRFYCKTCQLPICRDCTVLEHHQHQYQSLKIASEDQVQKLMDLAKQGQSSKKKYTDEVRKVEDVEKKLDATSDNVKKTLRQIKSEYQKQLDATFKNRESELDSIKADRAKRLDQIKKELTTKLSKIDNACDLATKVVQMGSDHDVTSIFPTLSQSLQDICDVKDKTIRADESLGYIGVESFSQPDYTNMVRVTKSQKWKQVAEFDTQNELPLPWEIAVHPNGNIALTNGNLRSAKIFGQDGKSKYTFKGRFDSSIDDITLTPDDRFILTGNDEILFYDTQGNLLSSVGTYDINNKRSWPVTLATDSRGRILTLLSSKNTISIHHANGHPISKFSTKIRPLGLAVSSQNDIVATMDNRSVHLMDYKGQNVRVLQQPQDATVWYPINVCCSQQGEIFITSWGSPNAVYRYTAAGDKCLGCVADGFHKPVGLDITEDGQKLYVVDSEKCVIKVFERQ